MTVEKDGQRLDKVLTASIPKNLGLSRSRVKEIINLGGVLTTKTNEVVGQKYKSSKGESLILNISLASQGNRENVVPESLPIEVVFEDKDLIVVNKQAGLVVHPGAGIYSGTLVNALLHHSRIETDLGGTKRPGIVHRLDKDTTGLMVIAKTDLSYVSLSKQFSEHTASREYTALVWGDPTNLKAQSNSSKFIKFEKSGLIKIESRIGRHQTHRQKMSVREGQAGKLAITRFKVEETFCIDRSGKALACLIRCWLETGRTHQIRVHLAEIDHGIVGDQVYNSRRRKNDDSFDAVVKKMTSFKRQALHAHKLSFCHPRTEEQVSFEALPPGDFSDLIKLLKCF